MKPKFEEVEILLEGLDEKNITSLLKKWNEISLIKVKINNLDEMIRTKIKIYLKERNWNRYQDIESGVSVNLTKSIRTNVDINELKRFLSAGEISQVMRTVEFEKLTIMTPESMKNIKKIMRGKI
jgi:hypothetical protein